MKILKTLFIGMVVLALASAQAYGEPGKGKGKAKGHDKENQSESNKGNSSNSQSVESIEKRTHEVEKGRRDADIRTNIPEDAKGNNSSVRANYSTRIDRRRSADHFGKKETSNDKVKGFFNALEHARWSYNPNDEIGQGNMGKPKMRDPYGFDKDSGREGGERGRPNRETLNLAEITNIDFFTTDYFLNELYILLERYQAMAQLYPENTGYPKLVTYMENYIAAYTSYPFAMIPVEKAVSIDSTLSFSPPDGFEGTSLLVTTSITSISDYTFTRWVLDPVTGIYYPPEQLDGNGMIHYDAGQVIMEQTQEAVLGDNNTLSFSYDPPAEMTGPIGFFATETGQSGIYAELTITVTEPLSGETYTMTYDRQLYLYRCPYGKVYNAKTHQPVVGAKVTVHFDDGSIVPLDKASNPTAKNPQITDATGRYGVKLETNRKYYITAKADGYKDYKSEVFTEKWHVLREDVSLTPIEELASK